MTRTASSASTMRCCRTRCVCTSARLRRVWLGDSTLHGIRAALRLVLQARHLLQDVFMNGHWWRGSFYTDGRVQRRGVYRQCPTQTVSVLRSMRMIGEEYALYTVVYAWSHAGRCRTQCVRERAAKEACSQYVVALRSKCRVDELRTRLRGIGRCALRPTATFSARIRRSSRTRCQASVHTFLPGGGAM